MRKRIAVFANGWGTEYLQQVGRGIVKKAKEMDTDVYAFINFSAYSDTSNENKGETDIFYLPKMEDFDGVIILTNSINLQSEIEYLQAEISRAKIPSVSLECPLEDAYFIETDNRSGITELTRHLIKSHSVDNIVYLGGYKGHKENEERLAAVLETALENGVRIPEENILYGDWSLDSSIRCIGQWMDEHGNCPDAVICANDLMAIGTCQWFAEHGYDVPGDVKVTGYDNLRQGMENWPALTSISQEWEQMGYDATQILNQALEGKEVPGHLRVKTKTVYRESCGCKAGYGNASFSRTYAGAKADGLVTDRHFRHLYMAVRKNHTENDFNRSLSHFYKTEGWMEGRDFMLCVHPDYFSSEQKEETLKCPGYPEQMNVICSLKDGVAEDYRMMSTKETIFMHAENKPEAGVYLFVPIHSEDRAYGYAALSRDFEISADNILYIWTRHMRQYLEQVYSNIQIEALNQRLQKLSVTDMLTGTYNRTGCEQIIYPKMEMFQESGKQGLILLADLDRLKIINDTYGHDFGDKALQIVSQALLESLPEDYMVARFGGDEFLVAGVFDGETSPSDMSLKIYKRLEELVEQEKLPFDVTVSIGGTIMKVGQSFHIKECVQKADKNLYEVKERHHQGLI